MLRIVVLSLVFTLFISWTISAPTCNVSYWVNPDNATCSSSPNGTYSAMIYNGTCNPSPDDPQGNSYILSINLETKTVQNFIVYDGKTCGKGNEMVVAKPPLSLSTCGVLYFQTTSTSFVPIGSLVFNCQE